MPIKNLCLLRHLFRRYVPKRFLELDFYCENCFLWVSGAFIAEYNALPETNIGCYSERSSSKSGVLTTQSWGHQMNINMNVN